MRPKLKYKRAAFPELRRLLPAARLTTYPTSSSHCQRVIEWRVSDELTLRFAHPHRLEPPTPLAPPHAKGDDNDSEGESIVVGHGTAKKVVSPATQAAMLWLQRAADRERRAGDGQQGSLWAAAEAWEDVSRTVAHVLQHSCYTCDVLVREAPTSLTASAPAAAAVAPAYIFALCTRSCWDTATEPTAAMSLLPLPSLTNLLVNSAAVLRDHIADAAQREAIEAAEDLKRVQQERERTWDDGGGGLLVRNERWSAVSLSSPCGWSHTGNDEMIDPDEGFHARAPTVAERLRWDIEAAEWAHGGTLGKEHDMTIPHQQPGSAPLETAAAEDDSPIEDGALADATPSRNYLHVPVAVKDGLEEEEKDKNGAAPVTTTTIVVGGEDSGVVMVIEGQCIRLAEAVPSSSCSPPQDNSDDDGLMMLLLAYASVSPWEGVRQVGFRFRQAFTDAAPTLSMDTTAASPGQEQHCAAEAVDDVDDTPTPAFSSSEGETEPAHEQQPEAGGNGGGVGHAKSPQPVADARHHQPTSSHFNMAARCADLPRIAKDVKRRIPTDESWLEQLHLLECALGRCRVTFSDDARIPQVQAVDDFPLNGMTWRCRGRACKLTFADAESSVVIVTFAAAPDVTLLRRAIKDVFTRVAPYGPLPRPAATGAAMQSQLQAELEWRRVTMRRSAAGGDEHDAGPAAAAAEWVDGLELTVRLPPWLGSRCTLGAFESRLAPSAVPSALGTRLLTQLGFGFRDLTSDEERVALPAEPEPSTSQVKESDASTAAAASSSQPQQPSFPKAFTMGSLAEEPSFDVPSPPELSPPRTVPPPPQEYTSSSSTRVGAPKSFLEALLRVVDPSADAVAWLESFLKTNTAPWEPRVSSKSKQGAGPPHPLRLALCHLVSAASVKDESLTTSLVTAAAWPKLKIKFGTPPNATQVIALQLFKHYFGASVVLQPLPAAAGAIHRSDEHHIQAVATFPKASSASGGVGLVVPLGDSRAQAYARAAQNAARDGLEAVFPELFNKFLSVGNLDDDHMWLRKASASVLAAAAASSPASPPGTDDDDENVPSQPQAKAAPRLPRQGEEEDDVQVDIILAELRRAASDLDPKNKSITSPRPRCAVPSDAFEEPIFDDPAAPSVANLHETPPTASTQSSTSTAEEPELTPPPPPLEVVECGGEGKAMASSTDATIQTLCDPASGGLRCEDADDAAAVTLRSILEDDDDGVQLPQPDSSDSSAMEGARGGPHSTDRNDAPSSVDDSSSWAEWTAEWAP